MTIKGKEQEPKVVTVNDKAATRQAIINYLEERLPIISRNKFLERSDWHAKPPKGQLEEDWNYFGIVFHHQGNSPCNPPTKKHQLKVEISRKLLQGEFL